MQNFCIYCEKDDSRFLYKTEDINDNRYSIKECNACRAFFLSPRPGENELNNAYDDSYYGQGENKFSWLIEGTLDFLRRRKAHRIASYIGGKGRVLDIGCGNGKLLSFLKKEGDFDLQAIEREGGSARRAAEVPGINLRLGTLKEGDFKEESLDAVLLYQVFEHLSNPAQTLNIISRIVKKGGFFIVAFPNIASLQSRIFKGKWFHLDPPRHLVFFAPDEFEKKLENLGWKLVSENHFNIEYNAYGIEQSLLNVMLRKRDVLYERLKGNQIYAKEYGGFLLFIQKVFFVFGYPLFFILSVLESMFRKGGSVEYVFQKKYTNSELRMSTQE
ncbi:MAG: methionine biosynthesis protein MetW [bacterium]|nr:methionine biosynthesis protein MetW [bacterium]